MVSRMRTKLMAMLLIGLMTAMMLPGISSGPAAPEVGATIESGNLNPTCQYILYATADAYTSTANPNTNYGSSDIMSLKNDSGAPPAKMDVYLQFNPSTLPDDIMIDKASLSLYLAYISNPNYGASGTNGFYLPFYEVTSAWDESTITWNLAPTNDSAKLMVSYQPRVSPLNYPTGIPSVVQEFRAYQDYDLTPFAQRWYNGTDANYGFMLPADFYPLGPGITYATMNFLTKEAAEYGCTPMLTITAHSIKSAVHLSYYNAFTGLGIAPYTFNVSTAVNGTGYHRSTQDITSAIIGQNLTVNVTDYFGRTLYNVTRMINDSDYFWDIALPVFSYRFTNNGDQYTRLWMYYDPAQPPYRCFIPPHETESLYLYPGWYRFAATVYDANGITGQTYTWIRTVSDIGYVMLNGATITEVLNVANGVQAQQKVITDILTPNVIWLGFDMPMVPSHISMTNSSATLPTRIVLESNTIQTKSGNFTYFNSTAPSALTVTTRTILYDDFFIMGNVSTHIMINESGGAMVYNATILPSGMSLFGKDYTIWTNRTVSVTRNIGFRYSSAFSYSYYPSGHALGSMIYEADTSFQNPSDTTWRSISLFIPFQNSTYADNRSLVVWDLNNSIYLTAGVHYSVSNTGVYMFFPTIGNGTWRGFRIDYSVANNTPTTPPRIIVTTVGDGTGMTMTWQSMTWFFAKAAWTNTYSAEYSGSIYIVMQTSIPMDYNQEVIVMNANGYVLTNVIIAGATIIIPSVTVAVGDAVSYTILFKQAPSGSPTDLSFAGISLTTFLGFAMMFTLGASLVLKFVSSRAKDAKKADRYDSYANGLLTLCIVCLAAIVFAIIYALGSSAQIIKPLLETILMAG